MMVTNLGLLLKCYFMNLFGLNVLKHEMDDRKKRSQIALTAAFTLLGAMLVYYCYKSAEVLCSVNMAELIPGFAITITSLITLCFTFIKTNGVLFGSRDYDFLMSLPIKTSTVITSKFLSMYLNNLIFTLVVMVPMAVKYISFTSSETVTILFWTVGIILAPLFPMTIASIVGALIMAFGAGRKHKVFAQVALSLILIFGVFAASYWLQKNATDGNSFNMTVISDVSKKISGVFHKIYPLSAWFDEAVMSSRLSSLLLFSGISIVTYGVFSTVCGVFYRKINSKLQAHHSKNIYVVGELNTNSVMLALVKKEIKRFFSSTVYIMNIGIGLIIALLGSISGLIVGIDSVVDNIDTIMPFLSGMMPFIIAAIVNLSCTTSVSLSLEGKSIWIVESLPISRKTLLQSKMLFNIILVMPVSIICSILFIIQLKVTAIQAVLYIVVSIVSVLFSTAYGMFINTKYPNYEWNNEVEVIKQGMSSMIGVFSNMLIYAAMAAVIYFLNDKIEAEYLTILFVALLAAGGATFYSKCK